MTINEMHVQFRVLGQQMGMQLIRSILPESIDAFLNAAISDKVHSILLTNTQKVYSVDKYKNVTYKEDTAVSSINAFRTLSKEVIITTKSKNFNNSFIFNDRDVLVLTSLSITYDGNKFYKARLIETDKLEDTINDYCNSASKHYPVVSIISKEEGGLTIQVYPYVEKVGIKIKYIESPAIVRYNEVDCNLPEYLHHEIVELAVAKYQKAIYSTTPSANATE